MSLEFDDWLAFTASGNFDAGIHFEGHDEDFLYDGRISVDLKEYDIAVLSPRDGSDILRGYGLTPNTLRTSPGGINSSYIARDVIAIVIQKARQTVELTPVKGQLELPLA